MGGSNTGGGAGGNTGADAGFFISEQKKKEKINDSLIGESDYQGDVNPQKKSKKKATITYDDGGQGAGAESGNNTITQVTKTAPTVAEVDQATTDTAPTETAETTEANRLLKIKKKGRSMTMMSGAKGVTRTSSDYSLGKKSLLGMV